MNKNKKLIAGAAILAALLWDFGYNAGRRAGRAQVWNELPTICAVENSALDDQGGHYYETETNDA